MMENQDGYHGPIEAGMTFVWEPNKPHARKVVTVLRVDRSHHDARIWTSEEVWNEESRFREAVVDVTDLVKAKVSSKESELVLRMRVEIDAGRLSSD